MKKYSDVMRYGKAPTVHMIEGSKDYIIIQEKLDGANASFRAEDGLIKAFSRNKELDAHETLRGFYGFVQDHLGLKAKDMNERYIYFGEWLIQHKVHYRDEAFGRFYLFDVYDTEAEKYLSFGQVQTAAEELDLMLIPVLYEGPYQSLEHIQSFVGKSVLGPVGEGVVVKNANYSDKHGNQLYTKFVSKEFTEMANIKEHKIDKQQKDGIQLFVEASVSKARVHKLLLKLVDEGHLVEDFAIEHMGQILKLMGPRLFEDIVKEESDVLFSMVKGKIGKYSPLIIKEVLQELGRM